MSYAPVIAVYALGLMEQSVALRSELADDPPPSADRRFWAWIDRKSSGMRRLAAIPLFGAAIVAGIWFGVLQRLDSERAFALEAATRDTESYVKAFAEHTQRILGETDRILLLIKYQFEKDGSVDLSRMVRRDLIPEGEFLAVNIVGSDGAIRASTREEAVGMKIGDRDYFRLNATTDTRRLNISKPIQGRGSGKAAVVLSRRLNAPDGSFAGVVVLVVEPIFFTGSYQETALGRHGFEEVVDLDGAYLARRSGDESDNVGSATGAAALLAHVAAAPAGSYERTGANDRYERIVAYRALADRSIVVAAGQAKDEILADFVRHRSAFLFLAWVVSALVLSGFAAATVQVFQLQHSRQRARLARQTLNAAIEGSRDAFFLLTAVRNRWGAIDDFVFQECSGRAAELLQVEASGVIGARLRGVAPALREAAFFDKYVGVVETGDPIEEEFAIDDPRLNATWVHHEVVKVNDGVAVTARDISERKHDAEELDRQRRLLQTILDNIPTGVVVRRVGAGVDRDGAGEVVLWNRRSEAIFGTPAAKAVGKTARELLPPRAAETIEALDRELVASPGVQEKQLIVVNAGGRGERTVSLLRAPMFDDRQRLEYVVAIADDITDAETRANEIQLASKVFETTADGIVITDADERIVTVNGAFTSLSGFTREEMVGKLLNDSPFRPLDIERARERLQQQLRDNHISCEVERRHKDGRILSLWLTASLVRNDLGAVVHNVRVFSDISQIKDAQRRLEILAQQDSLTGLANRRSFHALLEKAVLRANRSDGTVSLLFVDVDHFKQVNDSFGHAAGDAVLQEVARRIQSCIRGSDHACRLGGDEFTVILEDAGLPADPDAAVQRIIATLETPIKVDDHYIAVTVSIGVASYPADSGSASELISNADAAMYEAKGLDGASRHVRNRAPRPDAPTSAHVFRLRPAPPR